MSKIEWKIVNNETKQEITSTDNRWHISKTQKGEDECNLFLTNFDLLLTPHGSGVNYKKCFESFIKNCEIHIKEIRNAQQEAQKYINSISETESEGER